MNAIIMLAAMIAAMLVAVPIVLARFSARNASTETAVPATNLPTLWASFIGRLEHFQREPLSLRQSGRNERVVYKLYRRGSATPCLMLATTDAVVRGNSGPTLRFTVYDRRVMGAAKKAGRWLKNRLGANTLDISKLYLES